MTRYLTKSRFKLALECPAKLYYTKKPEYPDQSAADPFLVALAEGGAAMTVYARMQFTSMPAEEKNYVEQGFLRYCELDTMAMVFIWEYWKNLY